MDCRVIVNRSYSALVIHVYSITPSEPFCQFEMVVNQKSHFYVHQQFLFPQKIMQEL